MNNRIIIALKVILFICIFSIGFLSGMLFKSLNNLNGYDGLFLKDYNHTSAMKTAKTYDAFGNWVCINVDGMDYKRAVEVCSHEVGHEIFAEKCEKNPDLCFKIAEELDET
jgi:hypothetical protein